MTHAALKDRSLLIQAIARGWCHPKNSHKVMDPDLAEAIADELSAALSAVEGEAVHGAAIRRSIEDAMLTGTGILRIEHVPIASVAFTAPPPQQAVGDANAPDRPRFKYWLGGPVPPRQQGDGCTCPSGDGSLRWPCPAHPPESIERIAAPTPSPGPQGGGEAEPNMRHPKIQSLIGANARLGIELSLIESLLFDPEFEMCGSDWDYETEFVTKVIELRNKLSALSTTPASGGEHE